MRMFNEEQACTLSGVVVKSGPLATIAREGWVHAVRAKSWQDNQCATRFEYGLHEHALAMTHQDTTRRERGDMACVRLVTRSRDMLQILEFHTSTVATHEKPNNTKESKN